MENRKKRVAKTLWVFVLLIIPMAAYSQAAVPYMFTTGSVASADEVNENFAALAAFSVPKGAILMWSGSITTIPDGWALCDGTSHVGSDGGTVVAPDLRGRFIVGFNSDDPDYDSMPEDPSGPDTGGEKVHQLTETELPSHTHAIDIQNNGSHSHSTSMPWSLMVGAGSSGTYSRWNPSSYESLTTSAAGDHTHNATISNTGDDVAHENRPPYFVLAFIIKL